jgi:uncharacterized HAD superfamily protein
VARVYVDLDDVLSQTIRGLIALLEREHGRRVREEDIRHFDLGRSFGLAPAELDAFMRCAHRPEELGALEPSPGAAAALESWTAGGHEVFVMTGRPPSSEASSRRWLEAHGMSHARLASVDKYGRPDRDSSDKAPLSLDALGRFDFSLAVEDSLDTAIHLAERCQLPVALIDRPWNRDVAGLSEGTLGLIVRCSSWEELLLRFPEP